MAAVDSWYRPIGVHRVAMAHEPVVSEAYYQDLGHHWYQGKWCSDGHRWKHSNASVMCGSVTVQ